MKFIQDLLETAESVGLGYYVIDDYENTAVCGPYKTKAEADKNKKSYYPNEDDNTFSVKYGTISRKGGHFTPTKSSTPVTETVDEKIMVWTANSGNVDANHPERTHTIGFFETREEAITALKNSKNKLIMGSVHQTEGMSSWLTKKLKEDAAAGSTAAGDMAGARGSLFGGVVTKRKIPKAERVQRIRFTNRANWNIRESFMSELLEFDDTGNKFTSSNKFNSADVISKLTAAEKQTDFDRTSTAFGIEDDSGNVVKVYVPPEQADDFQKVIGTIVADTAMNNQEIGEILFNLKDKFDIINVEWPALPEDEEETASPAEGEDDTSTDLELTDDSTDNSGDNVMDIATEPPGDVNSSDSSVSSALDKVIDMLKADADARTAEANAKSQEAKAKEAEYASKMAEQRVKSEEEVLDMETFYKNKSDDKKEAQKLMKLAKYRHDLAGQAEEDLS